MSVQCRTDIAASEEQQVALGFVERGGDGIQLTGRDGGECATQATGQLVQSGRQGLGRAGFGRISSEDRSRMGSRLELLQLDPERIACQPVEIFADGIEDVADDAELVEETIDAGNQIVGGAGVGRMSGCHWPIRLRARRRSRKQNVEHSGWP